MADLSPLPDEEISQEEFDTWKQNLVAKLSQDPDYQLFLNDGNVLSAAPLHRYVITSSALYLVRLYFLALTILKKLTYVFLYRYPVIALLNFLNSN